MMNNEPTRIYFQDNYCAVVYKAAGEDCQSFFKSLFSDAGFAQPVHRLDQPVSGLVIIAFSTEVQTAFSQLFMNNAVKKEYWAICERRGQAKAGNAAEQTKTTEQAEPAEQTEGSVQKQGRIEQRLGFDRKKQKAFVCKPDTKKQGSGKKAVLEWECCGAGDRYDFIKVLPLTGRTHQIRVQLASIGKPIKGDLKYGARRSEKGGGIRLHAAELHFTHPVTGEETLVSAPPAEADTLWQACITACTVSHATDTCTAATGTETQ